MVKKITYKILLSTISLSLAVGCIDAYELDKYCNLDFSLDYTFDPPGQALLPVLTGNIAVYVFNQSTKVLTGIIYVGKEDIARGHMSANLPVGIYTFVCWATDGEHISTGGYFPAHMSDPSHSVYTDITIGTTTYDEFRMMLDCDELPSGSIGDVTPSMTNFEDIFFSMREDVFIDGNSSVTIPFSFIRDTNMLNIHIEGLENYESILNGAAPKIFVTAPHERYFHDNSLSPYSRSVRFELPVRTVGVSRSSSTRAGTRAAEVDIKVQRMEVATYLTRPVYLYIQDPVTEANLIDPINVVGAILTVEDAEGNHPYEQQTDLDQEYEFDIDVELFDPETHLVNVKVTINEYEVVDVEVVT